MVYRATDATSGRRVAVKVLTSTARQNVERELEALDALSGHPNVVTLHRFGTTATGRSYLVLEYCEGGSLADLVAAYGPLPWQRATEIAIEVAGALAVAHASGVFHRDLKPSNVLLAAQTPKLADFGLAAVVGRIETGSAPVVASLAHAAPEVLDGGRADARSEVYSLSSTVYELVTGGAPFVRDDDPTILPALARIAREPVPALDPDRVPEPVAEALVAALAKDPDDRPQDMASWIARMNDARMAAGAEPVGVRLDADEVLTPSVAGPPPPPPDAVISPDRPGDGWWGRRPRRVLVTGAAVVAIGAMGSGMLTAATSIDDLDSVPEALPSLDEVADEVSDLGSDAAMSVQDAFDQVSSTASASDAGGRLDGDESGDNSDGADGNGPGGDGGGGAAEIGGGTTPRGGGGQADAEPTNARPPRETPPDRPRRPGGRDRRPPRTDTDGG